MRLEFDFILSDLTGRMDRTCMNKNDSTETSDARIRVAEFVRKQVPKPSPSQQHAGQRVCGVHYGHQDTQAEHAIHKITMHKYTKHILQARHKQPDSFLKKARVLVP